VEKVREDFFHGQPTLWKNSLLHVMDDVPDAQRP
jgi:hypothetical protein